MMEELAVTSRSPIMDTTAAAEAPGYVFEEPTQRSILAAVVILVTLIGVPGNSLVVLSKRLQTKTNAFVVNLAVSDLAACLVLPFQAIALLNDYWPLSEGLCTAVAAIVWVGLGSSVVNLALIAFNRYYLITRPRDKYDDLFSSRNMTVMLLLAWIIPVSLVTIPPLCGLGGIGFSERYKICSADSTHPLADVYAFLSSILVELPCLVVIITCYVKIYRFIRARNRNLICSTAGTPSTVSMDSAQSAAFKRQVRVTKNLFLVVCTYIVCIMPFAVACLIPPSYPVIPWVSIFLISNCCINPIIYGLKHPQFNEVFGKIISCKLRGISEPSILLLSFTGNSTSA